MWLYLVVALFGLAVLPAEVRAAPPPGFSDEFDSSSLDPAWQVYVNTGPRVYGYPLPANHYSMTDSPGKLRYYVDPMTHYDGFLNGYQTGYYSCCIHDPGLEISREFSGDNWMFETKADFYLPYTNGRFFVPRIYFGDGGAGTYELSFYVIRDLEQRYVAFQLAHKTSADIASLEILEQTSVATPPSAPATITYYLQVERAGGVLTARSSDDGVNWQTAFTHDTGTALSGLA
jgi:hypothetical protein